MKHYPHKLKQELKTLLSNRSVKSIERKAEEMKLKRTEETIFREIGNATKLKWIKGCFIDNWDSPIPREYDKSFNNLMKKYIAKRDNYTCQMCGKTKCDGGRFAVHHINYDKKFSDESNLIYLCNSCHMKTNVNRESWKSKFSAMAKDKYKPYRIEKEWGWELVLDKNYHYVSKLLHINKGHRLSLQYHSIKYETMILTKGKIKLRLGGNEMILEPKESLENAIPINIEPMTVHRVEAIEDSEIFEISTPEIYDIVRLEDDYGRVTGIDDRED